MSVPERLFRNPSRKAIRLLLILAAIFFAAGLPPVLFVHRFPTAQEPMSGGQLAGFVCMMIGLPLGLAMLLSALLTIPTARRTDRQFRDFLAGNFLAEWNYPPEQWNAFVASEARRLGRAGWVYLGFFVIPGVLMGFFIAWMASSTTTSKVLHCAFVLAGATIISVPYLWLGWIFRRRHHAQLLAYPKAYIGKNAVYCGGDFNFWGSGMRGLDSVRVLPGNPALLEVIVGVSKGAAKVAGAIDAINVATLQPTAVSSMKYRQVIPIPLGCEAQAAELVKTLKPAPARPAHRS